MKLQVSQPGGTPHQVELAGPEVVIGRDPSCDLVLSDERCSRRHAVLDDGPEGLTISDAGSSNGIRVNGRPLRRSLLRPGDTIRVGETTIEVLSEAAETVLISASGLRRGHEPSAPQPPTAPPRPLGPARPPPAAEATAIPTVTALAMLWALAAPTLVVGSLLIAVRAHAGFATGALTVGAGLVLGGFAGTIAVGLRARAPWARQLQIVAAGAGLLVCPFTFAAVTVLIYMLREDVKATFEGPSTGPAPGAGDAELTFALSLLGMLALGLGLTAAVFFLFSAP